MTEGIRVTGKKGRYIPGFFLLMRFAVRIIICIPAGRHGGEESIG